MPVKSILDEPKNLEILVEHYSIRNKSTTQIAKESQDLFGTKISAASIYTALKRNNIPVKSKSESVSIAKCSLNQDESYMNEKTIEALDGFLLGDGGIGRPSSVSCPSTRLNMWSTEKEWTEYALSFFSKYEPSEAKQSGKIREKSPRLSWGSSTKHHRDFKIQYERWYPNGGHKQVPEDVRITPLSILLWYLGDGSITKSGVSYVIRFATCSFAPNDIDNILLPKLEKIGLFGIRTKYKNDIKLQTSSVKRFFEIIGTESPISCYNYKFEFDQWLNYYRLSQIVRNDQEKWRVRYLNDQGKLDCTRSPGNKLLLFNEKQANKLRRILDEHKLHNKYEDQDKKETEKLYSFSKCVKNDIERWNGRYLVSRNLVEHTRGKFTKSQKDALEKKLKFYGEKSAIPQKDVDRVFREYREKGFPYYDISFEDFENKINKIGEDNGNLHWDGFGSELATFFHPHIFECKHPGKMSALEFFNSDEDFKRGIKKIICLYPNITSSRVREICRNEASSSRINNFPPRVLVKVLNKLGLNNVDLLDPCHGFSGRLIGAYCSGKVKSYVGIDLSKDTHNGALRTKEWLEKLNKGFLFPIEKTEIELIKGDCLVKLDEYREKDIIFTSPPFLDKELYKEVDAESNYEKWINNFVIPFIEKCFSSLKDGGYFSLYIEKIDKHDFIGDVEKIANEVGFEQKDNLEFSMSYGENNRGNSSKRTIPILVFQKPKQ